MQDAIVNDFAETTTLTRLCAGEFDDPFAILGPHKKGRVRHVTAFDPGAERVWAKVAAKRYELAPANKLAVVANRLCNRY